MMKMTIYFAANGNWVPVKCCFCPTSSWWYIFLHAIINPKVSQLCRHLEITLIEPLRHNSSRNVLLCTVDVSLCFKCFFPLRPLSGVHRLFFIHPVSHLQLFYYRSNLELTYFVCRRAVTLRCYNSSSFFVALKIHKLASCKLRMMWQAGRKSERGGKSGKIMLCSFSTKERNVFNLLSVYVIVHHFSSF